MLSINQLRQNASKVAWLRSLPREVPVLDTGGFEFSTTKVGSFSIFIRTNSGGDPVIADYGDGSRVPLASGANTHSYSATGPKTVGIFPRRLDKIQRLYMTSDNCYGTLPSFAKCTDLEDLELQTNGFTGTLPSFSACTKLDTLLLTDNSFSGEMPSFENCTLLTRLYATNCPFTGALPSFAACTLLGYLSLGGCHFSGALPSFAYNTQLVSLYLGVNEFSGTIPSFAPCHLIQTLDLNHQHFSGDCPSFAGNTALQYLWLNDNQLTGTIPDFSMCTDLRLWGGDTNNWTGYTPGSFATQPNLSTFTLYSCGLSQAVVDNVLADFVTSLALPGRVHCTVQLQTNSVPSAGGLADKATLIAAGWTVYTD